MTTPLVMVSYSWDDADAGELLHEELAMRGVAVAHDCCTFPTGTRIAALMRDAADTCDGYVAYLTPSSLYEGRPPGPRPVIEDELLPVMDRLTHEDPPIIVALVHGLGDPRTDAVERVRRATGRDIGSLWMPVTLDQSSSTITQLEAAAVADNLTAAVLRRHAPQLAGGLLELSVVSRGTGQVPTTLSIDATSSLGGDVPRPGSESDWTRFAAGVRDLETNLALTLDARDLRIVARAHLTGALIVGRSFHQAAGWSLTVAGRHGDAAFTSAAVPDDLRIATDVGARTGDVSVEIDLLGVGVTPLAAAVLAAAPEATTSRLTAWRETKEDLSPNGVAGAAKVISDKVRDLVHDRRADLVHLFCAAPVDVAVLLGHRLTSLHTDVQLYERDGTGYVPSFRLPC
jgi:hypothetical protein